MKTNAVVFGDCRDTMRKMISDGVRVQMCVTSPPYFGLRDYGHPGQLGLEATPQEYVDNMVEVFSLVRELLSDDGVLWLNLGDSYAAGGMGAGSGKQLTNRGTSAGGHMDKPRKAPDGWKAKDLIGIPWRVAFALQEDGWYLRQDIIWHKPNPMPESVTDRCTKAHEYMFLLSKSERYYFDSAAIQEQAIGGTTGNTMPTKCGMDYRDGASEHRTAANLHNIGARETRNKRSVWTVPTLPYSGAHFATFPPALIEPCILAGTRNGDIVFDPFFGSGTTGQVAQALGRQWIGCEINEDYAPLQKSRTAQSALPL